VTSEENIAAQLNGLLDQGTRALSRCSALLLETLRPLLQAGVVVEERSSAGRRLSVRDPAALREFTRRRFPNAPMATVLASRVAGVAGFRNSKVFASDTPELVSLRAWREDALTKDAEPVGAAAATMRHGAFTFLLRPASSYVLHGTCALVENPIVFTEFERLQLPVALVICSHGRVSKRILDWLTHMDSPDFRLVHLPDYDPVGLGEFVRLRQRLGSRVSLHVPTGIEQRFARFSNPALLGAPNSQAMLATLRQEKICELHTILELINRHNAGLEQEALLL
jgi:hypothetical protein